MCGRFTLRAPATELADHFGLTDVPEITPRFNIAPTQLAGFLLNDGQHLRWHWGRWGLVPSWSKDPSQGGRLFNARSETVGEKPSFRQSWKNRRCLIPADGFYEWKTYDGAKLPFYFTLQEEGVFAFAGLWERWKNPQSGELLDTFTILTTEPNRHMKAFHHRMPVILHPRDYQEWMTNQTSPIALCKPLESLTIKHQAVSTKVNSVKFDQVECITPVPSQPDLYS
jgi:putative SOS response-associated peptidase YedK